MSEGFYHNLEMLPGHLANHLMIVVLPLLLGMAISLPLAVLAVRYRSLRYPALTAVSVIQTVPSLALLALMVPVLVGLSWLTSRVFGVEVAALGFYPTIIALTLYSMLPMLRNTVTGILDVDPALTEAARGMGMTRLQSLWKVEFPLALPVILAGVRTASVWTVGIATLATPVGQRCLGNYIFRGLQTRDWGSVLFGCITAAILAIVLDFLIGGVQKAVDERRRGLGIAAGAILAAIVLCGLVSPSVVEWMRQARVAVATEGNHRPDKRQAVEDRPESTETIVIGCKTFTEQYILAEVIARTLRGAGVQVEKMESLGSTVVFDGLSAGEIDCYVDYSGTVWANYMERTGPSPRWKVMAEVSGWLAEEHGVRCLGKLGFENTYALAMRREHAERLEIDTIVDLTPRAPQMTIGGDYEFFGRPEWQSLQQAYDLKFGDRTTYDSTFMYESVAKRAVDVISAFSSDGRIKAFDLRVLDDPRGAIPPYDAILLLSSKAARQTEVVDALRPLIGAIRVEAMREANYMVDRDDDKKSVPEAAAWLMDRLQ